MSGTPDPRTDGFILVETIVAFAVLALALGVAMQTISQSAQTIVRAGEVQSAGLAYETLLSTELSELTEEGDLEGTTETGASWRATARLIRDGHARPLLSISTRIWPRGGNGPSFAYQTYISNPVPQTP